MIYFGGKIYFDDGRETDKVVEYINLEWSLLGNLASPRFSHRSIKMDNKIYISGGVAHT